MNNLLYKLGISDEFSYFFISSNNFCYSYEKGLGKYRKFGTTKSKYVYCKTKRKRMMRKASLRKNKIRRLKK